MYPRTGRKIVIKIDAGGNAKAINGPEAAAVLAKVGGGRVAKRRASHVLPEGWLTRQAFRLIRWALGESGRAAAWTRTWGCRWRAHLSPSNGPTFGPYSERSDAIKAELAWLGAHRGL